MKKSLLFVAAFAVLTVVTGCMSTHTNDATAIATVSLANKEFTPDIVAGKTAVAGTSTIHSLFGIISWGASEFADDAFVTTSALPIQLTVSPNTLAKQSASYKACEANNADFIVAAKYKLDIQDFFVYKKIKCDVKGYPATIKGVK